MQVARRDELVRRAVSCRLSSNTTRTYRAQWRRWERWAAGAECSPANVCRFLAELAETRKVSTVRTALAALSAEYPGLRTHPAVQATMKGLSRIHGTKQKQARAMDDRASQQVVEWLETSGKPTARQDIALIETMRDGMLRRSEASNIRWEDIEADADGSGILTIPVSKADQEGKGTVVYLSRQAMRAIDKLPKVKHGPFALHPATIARRLRAAAQKAGLGDGFSGHSCRIGMAQDLAQAGTDLTQLMNAGRWKSANMPAYYTRNQSAKKGAIAQWRSRQ